MAGNTQSRCGARSAAVLLALDAVYLESILRLTTDQSLFARGRLTLHLAISALALTAAGYLLSNCTPALRTQYSSCTYDTAIKEYGVISALVRPSAATGGWKASLQ